MSFHSSITTVTTKCTSIVHPFSIYYFATYCLVISKEMIYFTNRGFAYYKVASHPSIPIANLRATTFFSFASSAWITLLSNGGSWSLKATVDLKPRQDTGRINTSPTVDIPPLVRLLSGCNYKLDLLGIVFFFNACTLIDNHKNTFKIHKLFPSLISVFSLCFFNVLMYDM